MWHSYFVITARVRSTREGNVLTSVCPSIHPSVHRGGYPYPIMLCNISQNAMRQRGRTQSGTPQGGTRPPGGYPDPPGGYPDPPGGSGYPPGGSGYPPGGPGTPPGGPGTPPGGLGTPLGGSGVRVPPWGGSRVRYPPGGGVRYPPGGGTQSGTPPGQDRRSTHYTAGGMPLAFTQEDFLVSDCYYWTLWD